MKRILISALAVLALAVPVAASGKVIQLGSGDPVLPASNCPDDPCLAAYQMTGYQEVSDGKQRPYVVRRKGMIVAFTVKLGRLTQTQIDAFDSRIGSPSAVRLSIVRRGKKRRRRNDHRLLAQSETFRVQEYFGSAPTFVLSEPISVERGNIVALTVPTWAPVLAQEDAEGTLWRSSRPRGGCKTTSTSLAPDSAKQKVGVLSDWRCNYRNERLLYQATYIPENRKPKPPAAEDEVSATAASSQIGAIELR